MAIPPLSDTDAQQYWIKQSELLQGVINRMASNSLEVKKFGVTVWTAIVGFGVSNNNGGFFKLALAAVVIFGILDLYYLFLERKFRDNYNRLVRLISGYGSPQEQQWATAVKGNFMSLAGSAKFLGGIPKVIASWANLPYLIMLAVTIWLFFVDFAAPSPAP
ncbi:MAG: hypothetical protein AAF289_10655 [Cyanobacteria bacterium P01_A01_bin.135]